MNAPNTSRPEIPPTVKTLGAVSFFNDIASEMIYPIIPIFLTSVLGAPVAVIGLIEGVAEATASFLKLVSGWWSDKIGRRKPIVALGYGCSVIAKPIFAAAHAWPVVLAGRFLDRFGKGVRTSARDAWIADVTPQEIRGRSFGLHRVLDTLGAIVGPLLAVLLLSAYKDDLRMIFLISFVPGLIAFGLLLAVAKEARRQIIVPNGPPELRGWRRIPASFWYFIAFAAIFALANSSDAFLILRGKSLGWSTSAAVLAYALYNTTYALASYPAGALSDRIGRRPVFVAGVGVFVLSYAAFAFVSRPAWLWPLFALYGLATALTEATSRALIADAAPKEVYGAAYGAYGTIMSMASLGASIWFGIVWQLHGPATAFVISAALAALGLLVAVSRKTIEQAAGVQ